MIIHLTRSVYWNVYLNEDRDIIMSIINKWGLMFVLGKEGVTEIRTLIKHFKKFSLAPFDPARLLEYNLENYSIQKDWISLRTVVINNFYKTFPEFEKTQGKRKNRSRSNRPLWSRKHRNFRGTRT